MTDNLQYIDIDKVRENPLNSYEMEDIEELTESIKAVGLMEPLFVFGPDEDGFYTLLSGERRLRAMRAAGKELFPKAPCKVDDNISPSEWEQKMKIELANLETRNFEKTQHIFNVAELLLDSHNGDRNAAAEEIKSILKCSDRYAGLITMIEKNGTDAVKERVRNGSLDILSAGRIANMDEEKQKDTIDAIDAATREKEKKLTRDETIDVIKGKKFSGKKTFSQKDLDMLEDDFDDDLNFYDDVSTSVTSNPGANIAFHERNAKSAAKSYENKLSMITEWCEEMKKKEEPTDAEMDVLAVCAEVVNKFM